MSRLLPLAAVTCAALVAGVLWYVADQPSEPVDPPAARTPAIPSAPAGAARPEIDAPSPPTDPTPPTRRATRAKPAAEPAGEPAAPPVAEAPRLGTLRIDTDVPGAQVFIDRRFIGTTPVTADDIEPGTHQLNLTAEGFDGIAQTIEVEPGTRDLTVRFREVRLDAAIAVVHKHRLGSCRGRLVATPSGVRYDTTHAEDGFSAPLGDLEAFQVDYLEKNLRLKLRSGRQFNFADPDGNADRLFVFHRDVERARQRIGQ
jgi:hypothetical protein